MQISDIFHNCPQEKEQEQEQEQEQSKSKDLGIDARSQRNPTL